MKSRRSSPLPAPSPSHLIRNRGARVRNTQPSSGCYYSNMKSIFFPRFGGVLLPALLLAMCAISPIRAAAQVSPNEILNPKLKALEKQYFSQLKTINQEISRTHFPFPFYLSRFVGLNPAKQAEADSRGLEFVH